MPASTLLFKPAATGLGDALSTTQRQAGQTHARSGRPVRQGGRERAGSTLAANASLGEKAGCRDPPPARHGPDVVADYDASRRRQKSERETSRPEHVRRRRERLYRALRENKTRRWRETARLLGLAYPLTGGEPTPIRGGLCERWNDKPVAEIDGHDIHSLVDETRRSGAPGLERRSDGPTDARARAMLSCLSKLFGWLVQDRRVRQIDARTFTRPMRRGHATAS